MNKDIAPEDLIIEDYKDFNPKLNGNIDPLLKDALRVLSVEGHSTQGHGKFKKRKFPETTQLDIAHGALGIEKTKLVREKVFEEITQTHKTLNELLNIAFNHKNPRNSSLYNHSTNKLNLINSQTGKPLWGFSQNKDLEIPTSQFEILQALKGSFLGFSMDTSQNRENTVKRFKKTLNDEPLIIGTGSCHVGYRKRIRKSGRSLEDLANSNISQDEIDWMYKNHLLVTVNEFRNDHNPELFPVFIRTIEGPGCCDDATTIGIGLMQYDLGIDFVKRAHMFARNSDYVDTFDKMSSSPITGGSDEFIGDLLNQRYSNLSHRQNLEITHEFVKDKLKRRDITFNELESELAKVEINRRTLGSYFHKRSGSIIDFSELENELLPENLASQEEITTSIYFGAKGNHPTLNFSNSVRRFEELQPIQANNERSDEIYKKGDLMYAGKAHEFFLESGSPVSGLVYGFSKFSSEEFYNIILQRSDVMSKRNLIPKPKFL